MITKTSVGILGGGITGLSVAYGLQKKGVDAVVYEQDTRPGGVIQSIQEEGWLFEKGPNTLQVRSREVWDLLSDLQLDDVLKKAGGTAKKRFIIKNGTPEPIPLSLTEFIKTKLFSASAKFRLLKEPFIPASDKEDESIARFVSRRLGTEPLNYAVDPFVSGVYAGNPDELSVRHTFSSLWEMEQTYGSLLKGAFRKPRNENKAERALISFEGGMETLPLALRRHLGEKVQCDTKVQKLTRTPGGWEVELHTPEGLTKQHHEVIVSTLPAHVLHEIFEPGYKHFGISPLFEIPYAPLSILALGFRREQVQHPLDGFGMLIPKAENFRMLGALFSSTLFPGRAPEGHVLLTCFIGGARNPELAGKPAEKLRNIVLPELSRLLHISGTPVYSRNIFWKRAIPQYEVGYQKYIDAIEEIENQNPGLLLAGNFRGGVSVPDCIVNGIETAHRAAMFVSSSGK